MTNAMLCKANQYQFIAPAISPFIQTSEKLTFKHSDATIVTTRS